MKYTIEIRDRFDVWTRQSSYSSEKSRDEAFADLEEKKNYRRVNSEVLKEVVAPAKNGIYRVFWKSGGSSLAAVGRDESGTPWMAPTNWIGDLPCSDFSDVKTFSLLSAEDSLRPIYGYKEEAACGRSS